jgi:hypothetical protein
VPHKPRKIWGLQAAEKPALLPILYRFGTGHDFSRADKTNKMTWAPAPAVRSSGKLLTKGLFSQPI